MATQLQPRYSPRFAVEVGSTTFQEPGGRIADLVVETTLSGADRFSFSLNYPFDEELGEFSGLEWSTFEIGTEVEIAMGYGGDGTLTPLLRGSIASIHSEFTVEQGPTVTISGFGLLKGMMNGTSSRSWNETTVGEAVEEVLSSYPFGTADVQDADIKRVKLIQDNQSDYRFIEALADHYGFSFYAERDTVRFRPQSGRGSDREPVAELWYGEALHDFYAEITDTKADHRVEVRSWDADEAEELVATAGPKQAANTEVFRVPVMSQNEAQRIADKKHSQHADGRITGHGEADGVPEIRAGEVVTLEELGGRFSGEYYITNATHRMGAAGYRTTFEAREVA